MHESPAAMSSAIRSFSNHTREYMPNVQATMTSLTDNLRTSYELRASISRQSLSYLQRLSSAQERMVSIGPQLQEADDLFGNAQDSYELLKEVESLAEGYGEGLQEGFRRGLWRIRRTKRLQKAKEEIAVLRSQERQARKAWGEVSANGGVVWSFVDNLSDDEDPSTPISNGTGESDSESAVTRKDIESYISEISKSRLFESIALSLKEHLQILITSIQTPQIDVATSPLRIHSSDEIPLKSREGQEIYETLLRDKTRAEERARNFESRVKNLEELLHRQFRTPPRNFSPVPSGSGPTSPRIQNDAFEDTANLGRSVLRTTSPDVTALQKRVQELEREKTELIERFTETEGTKSDLMANLEEQTKLFQAEREDLVRKTHNLEREVERCESEINRFEEMVPKMEAEIDALRNGRQTLLREMNLLQTESGAKIKELEDAKSAAEDHIAELQRDGETAAAEHERVRGEWRKASSAAENAHEELEKIRRLSNEHKVEHQRIKDLEAGLQEAKDELERAKTERDAASQEHLSLLNKVRDEINTLRDRITESLGLEKRKWETDSLIHAVNQKLATKDQRLTEVLALNYPLT
jgi:autophagy-related protein 11